MKRAGILCLFVILYTGCRAPMPSFNLLAPYGGTRVPPPATSSYATPGNYYPQQPGATPLSPAPSGSLQQVPAPRALSPSPAAQGANQTAPSEAELLLTGQTNPNPKFTWRPSRARIYTASQIGTERGNASSQQNEIQLASYQESVLPEGPSAVRTFSGDAQPIEIIERDQPPKNIQPIAPRLLPMPVNDFSKSVAPLNRRTDGYAGSLSSLQKLGASVPRGLTIRGQEESAPEADEPPANQIETISKQEAARWKTR